MNNKYYNHYNFYDISKEKDFDSSSLTLINHFDTLQQTTEYSCGPRCAEMVLKHLFKNDKENPLYNLDEMTICAMMKSRPYPHGTKLKNMVKFFNKINIKNEIKITSSIEFKKNKNKFCFSNFEDFRSFVIENLQKNNPIIIENIDYGGHYKVLIGYDKLSEEGNNDVLIFADSYDDTDGCQDGYNYFPAQRFFYMWFDDHCIGKKYRKQAFVVIEKQKIDK